MRTKAQLQEIRDDGGMIAAMLKDDKQDTGTRRQVQPPYTASPTGRVIADDCRHSSKTFAQMYQYSVDVMQGPVAFGSDWNGVAGHVGPRFGSDACGRDCGGAQQSGARRRQARLPVHHPRLREVRRAGHRDEDLRLQRRRPRARRPPTRSDRRHDLFGLNTRTSIRCSTRRRDSSTSGTARRVTIRGGTLLDSSTAKTSSVVADSGRPCAKATPSVADPDSDDPSQPLEQDPTDPYSLGTTNVTFRRPRRTPAARRRALHGTVTVVDQTAPTITCPAAVIAEC